MIQIQNLTKTFERPTEGPLNVLKSVDFQLGSGEFGAIFGPSGSGKTTLMNIIGLLDRADSGSYRLNDREVAKLNEKQSAELRNQTLGFVFQQFHLLPRTNAIENVALPLLYSNTTDMNDRAVAALCRVGLGDRLHHTPAQLSGGQQQRVAIARALVNEPDLILADEPTGNLDHKTAEEIMDLFAQLNQFGTTVLLITHDRDLAKRANRIFDITAGRLTESHRLEVAQ